MSLSKPLRDMGKGDIASLILSIGTRWRWVVNFTPRPLFSPGKNYDTDWVGGCVGPTAGLDGYWGEKISLPPGFESRTVQPLACSLYWLSYPVYSSQRTQACIQLCCVERYVHFTPRLHFCHPVFDKRRRKLNHVFVAQSFQAYAGSDA
jgi:hypothetical protein